MEKTLNSEEIFVGGLIKVRVDTVELANGRKSTREIVEHPGAVGILAVTERQEVVMVKQYRKPIEKQTLEIPAGKLDVGESPENCARRELKEETGYKPRKMERVLTFYSSPGFSDEVMHLFVASGLEKKDACPDEDEFVELVEVPVSRVAEMIKKGHIVDGKTLVAFLYLLNKKEL